MDAFLADVRYALRRLARSPGFTLAAVLTLALGLGANLAVFRAVDRLLLAPLPYPDADRIVTLGEMEARKPKSGHSTSALNAGEWRRRGRSFSAIALAHGWSPTLTGLGPAERLTAVDVSPEVFSVLGTAPRLGRPFSAADAVPGGPGVTIVSDAFFRARLGGDPAALGRALLLNGTPHTVIGVLPAGYRGPGELQAELLTNWQANARDTRASRSLRAFARLRDGVSLAAARAEMASISEQLAREFPADNKGMVAELQPLRDALVGEVRPALVLLFATSSLLLLLASVNLANLMLARGLARRRELAVRLAIGASRARIVRQLLAEAMVLGALGCGAGLLTARLTEAALAGLVPETLRGESPLDFRLVAFATLAAAGSLALFGLVPALRTTRMELRPGLAGQASTEARRLPDVLAATQLGLALVLLCASGLVLRTLTNLARVEPGLQTGGVLTAAVQLPGQRYPEAKQAAFYEQLVERLERVPGVSAAAVASVVPYGGNWDRVGLDVEGMAGQGAEAPEADRFIVTPQYAKTVGLPLRAGRFLGPEDRAGAPLAVVVDEVFGLRILNAAPFGAAEIASAKSPATRSADRLANVIGIRLKLIGRTEWATVVGVVGHVKHYGLDAESGGQVYLPLAQSPWRWMSVFVRTSGDPQALGPALRAAVAGLDGDLAVFDVATLDELLQRKTATRRLAMRLLSLFAGIALALAGVGLTGVLAGWVAVRKRELAIRLAIGARPAEVLLLVVRRAASLAGIGLAGGLLATLAAAGLLRGLLFQVGVLDPAVLGTVALLLFATAVAAATTPALRAARLDPVTVLRSE